MGEKSQIDKRMIRDLAKILNDTNLTEIEVEVDDVRIRVSRGGNMVSSVMQAPMHMPASAPAIAAPAPAAQDAAASAKPDMTNAAKSPMVGTSYMAASPSEPPFVKIGDTVKAGQTILIIEAMKTMNQIPAPKAGTVTAILVEDGQPIEYGEPLVIIE